MGFLGLRGTRHRGYRSHRKSVNGDNFPFFIFSGLMIMKTCSRCGKTLELNKDTFYKDARKPGGYSSICRDCQNEISRIWASGHRKQCAIAKRNWYKAHPERLRFLGSRSGATRRGLGFRPHRKNIIDEKFVWHHATDKSVIAIPEDIHQLYKNMPLPHHRFMCRQIISQIYN